MMKLTNYLTQTAAALGIISAWTVAFTALFAGAPLFVANVILPLFV